MPTCFVIQPFDSGKFDKRYEDVFAPAIKAAGLEPYRVDKDPGVDVPIDSIEAGIRASAACLADITTDNTNVWYELGFAFASGKPVVMVCAEDRAGRKYPFDIQHRTINSYQSDSPRDFEKLHQSIVGRLESFIKRAASLQAISAHEQVAPVEGLSQSELIVLVAVAGGVVMPTTGVSVHLAKNEVESAGFMPIAFTLGIHRLQSKGFIEVRDEEDFRGDVYPQLFITKLGWAWVEKNEDRFIIHKNPRSGNSEDIPF